MKAAFFLSSLSLAPLALAVPMIHTSILIAGASTKTVVLRPGAQSHTGEAQRVVPARLPSDLQSTTPEERPSKPLDAERPLTTEELMALSGSSSSESPARKKGGAKKGPKATKGKVAVGALVVPGSQRAKDLKQMLDFGNAKPYLIPGYYVSSQRADVLVLGMIVAFVLIVVAVETSSIVTGFVSRLFAREGRVRLEDDDVAIDLEDCELDSDDEDLDEDLAPFGGYNNKYRDAERGSLKLPEKLDEKAGWI